MGEPGTISWSDLTVKHADRVRDFYAKVVGWRPAAIDMGGYSDYAMTTPKSSKPVAGVCWKRGANADLPSQWLIYLEVADLAKSIKLCRRLRGKVLAGPRELSGGTFAVIRDPAGAVCALFEPPQAGPRARR